MITINNLDVQMDVEGEGDDVVFSRMFEKHITRWHRLEIERKMRQRLSDLERSAGDRRIEEHE